MLVELVELCRGRPVRPLMLLHYTLRCVNGDAMNVFNWTGSRRDRYRILILCVCITAIPGRKCTQSYY